jgi:hypothetical protein
MATKANKETKIGKNTARKPLFAPKTEKDNMTTPDFDVLAKKATNAEPEIMTETGPGPVTADDIIPDAGIDDLLSRARSIDDDWLVGELGEGRISRTQLLIIPEYFQIYLRHRRKCNTALLAYSERQAILEAIEMHGKTFEMPGMKREVYSASADTGTKPRLRPTGAGLLTNRN